MTTAIVTVSSFEIVEVEGDIVESAMGRGIKRKLECRVILDGEEKGLANDSLRRQVHNAHYSTKVTSRDKHVWVQMYEHTHGRQQRG